MTWTSTLTSTSKMAKVSTSTYELPEKDKFRDTRSVLIVCIIIEDAIAAILVCNKFGVS